jgi:glycosyltransferase involved in cell wall biosynthesis
MNIAVDVRMMWSSGIGSYIRNLIPQVMEIRSKDHFYLLGRHEAMERLEAFKKPNASWVEAKAPVYSLCEQWEFTHITPRDTDLFWSPFYVHPVFKKCRLLVTVHDVFHIGEPSQVKRFHRRLFARFMFNHLARKADAVLAVSSFTQGELLRLTGIDSRKVHVIHNGVNQSWFNVQKLPQSPHPKPYLLFVGNVKPHKNLGRLLKAYETLKAQIPHDLVLVGQKEGFITGDSAILKETEKLEGRVHFTGIADDKALQQFYAHASLLVVPSLYEGFGLPPLEAMACGCPVAVSKVTSLPEVCGDAALYFDPLNIGEMADRIKELLQDNKLRETLIKKGLEQAKKFSWDVSAKETNKVIESLGGQ